MKRRLYILGFLLREFRLYIQEERTWWLAPILLSLDPLCLFVSLAPAPGVSPFVYALF